MSDKYSPGPWHWDIDDNLVDADGVVILCGGGTEDGWIVIEGRPKDADLIAAAPEMLDILRTLVGHGGFGPTYDKAMALLVRITGSDPG